MKVLIWISTFFIGSILNMYFGMVTGLRAGAVLLYVVEYYIAKKLCQKWDEREQRKIKDNLADVPCLVGKLEEKCPEISDSNKRKENIVSPSKEKTVVSVGKKNVSERKKQISNDAQKVAEIHLNEMYGNLPVISEKAILFHNNQTDEFYLRCSFKSLTNNKITALLANVICYDIWENEICQIQDVQYLDFAAGRDETFGLEKKIQITDANTRIVGIDLKKVRLQDGTIIEAKGNKEKIPEIEKLLDYLGSGKLVQQYVRETTTGAVFVPVIGHTFWRCACDEVNLNSDIVCYHCKQSKEQIFNIFDRDYLEKSYALYAEQECLEEEQRYLERKC